MKRFTLLLPLIVLTVPQVLHARRIELFTDLDTYAEHAKTVFIGETLAIDDNVPPYKNVCRREMRVLCVLAGTVKQDKTIPVLVEPSLLPGTICLIYSGMDVLNEKGELDACTYQPGAVEIQLWGEVSKAEKQARVSRFIKELEGKPLKEQLLYIFKMRLSQLKMEEQGIKQEQEVLEKALKSK
ncbi:MAG: hypothetical protein ABSG82_00745 [Sedimentisphaerales bacterium]|jgi:hypothetical protein